MTKCGLNIFVVILLLTAIPSIQAASILHLLTPGHLTDSGFTFDITAKKSSEGTVQFRVLISEKGGTFTSSATALSIVKITRTPTETSDEIELVRTLPQEKKDKSIVCVFVVEEKALEEPNLSFVFTNYVEDVIDGKRVAMPSADFFYARLSEYLKR